MTTTAPAARRTAALLSALLALSAPAASAARDRAGLAGPPALQARAAPSSASTAVLAERALTTDARLPAGDALVATGTSTGAGGRTVVQLAHRHAGVRVWGSTAVAHVEPDGRVATVARALPPAADLAGLAALAGTPRLGAEEAVAAVLRRLAPRGPLAEPPAAELVAFPLSRRAPGAEGYDPISGRPVAARGRYGAPAPARRDWIWAWQVRTRLHNPLDGADERAWIVDGDTGAVLRADDLLQRVAPATGTGRGLYRGEVALDTTLMNDGTYALWDTTRGTLPNPLLSFFTDDGSGWTPAGLQVWWDQHDAAGANTFLTFLFQGDADNAWGDGLPFTAFGDEGGPNGQTAGVDLMAGMRATLDFYAQVLGRDGLDGQGTSVAGTALASAAVQRDNAFWSIGGHAGFFGVGTWPGDPAGLGSLTDLDVVAHELTHGLTSPSFDRFWVNSEGFEESGLNEATSDFFAEMVRLHALRAPGAPADLVPDGPGEWQIGASATRGDPLRWLDVPSRDGRSADAWYDGMLFLDGHFSSGPLNRALHFLARGAPADPASPRHSPYLPAGMAGLGNDAAARIWYRVVTEYLVPDGTGALTYADARAAALQAAADLFGAGSAAVDEVARAFAAINVGEAPGQAPRVKVWFKPWRNGDYVETTHATGYGNRQNLPRGERVRLRITVENTDDPRVTWRIGGPSLFNGPPSFITQGGVMNPDGTWTTPFQMGWHAVTAVSVADPTQFAEGRAFLINMDTDMDLEQDAVDMAGLSYSWFLTNGLNPSHSVYIAPWVDDADVAAFVDAMKAAWPAP